MIWLSLLTPTIFEHELNRKLGPQWDDPPLAENWTTPAPTVVQQIESAHGLVAERFAFCQTMPLDEFEQVAEKLRQSGYRPIRLRPYAHHGSVKTAAAWTRDGRVWQMAINQSKEAIQQEDEKQRREGFVAVDVAGYLGQTKEPAEYYACVWMKKSAASGDARIYAGAAYADHKSVNDELVKDGFKHQDALQGFRGLEGEQKYCGIKTNTSGSASWSSNQTRTEFEDKAYLDKIIWDIDASNASIMQTTKERYEQILVQAEAMQRTNPTDKSSRFLRGKAHFYLGQDQQAVEDMSILIEKVPQFAMMYQYRAVLYARMGQTEEAKQDLGKFQELSKSAKVKMYLDAIVSAYVGDDVEGMKRLETFIAENEDDSGSLYNAACAYSIASETFKDKGRRQVKSLWKSCSVLDPTSHRKWLQRLLAHAGRCRP